MPRDERERLLFLIGKQRAVGLTADEVAQMRVLVQKDYDGDVAALTVAGVVVVGLGLLAAWAFLSKE